MDGDIIYGYQPRSIWARKPTLDSNLIVLWGRGYTSKAIAEVLTPLAGQEITKNSVLSRTRRLNLPRRPSPIKRTPQQRAAIARLVGLKLKMRAGA